VKTDRDVRQTPNEIKKPQDAVTAPCGFWNFKTDYRARQSTAAGLEAVAAIHGSISGRLEGDLGLLAALGAGGIEELLGAAASSSAVAAAATTAIATPAAAAAEAPAAAATAAAVSTTATSATAARGLPRRATGGTALGLMREAALGIALLVLRGVHELGLAIRAHDGFVDVIHEKLPLVMRGDGVERDGEPLRSGEREVRRTNLPLAHWPRVFN